MFFYCFFDSGIYKTNDIEKNSKSLFLIHFDNHTSTAKPSTLDVVQVKHITP